MFSIDRAAATIIAIKQILALELEPTDERLVQAEEYLRSELCRGTATACCRPQRPSGGG